MKLQKKTSRKIKNKTYTKWDITLPADLIEELDWKAGDSIDIKKENQHLILNKIPSEKKVKEAGKKEQLSFFEKFFLVYSNLPLSERKMPVAVINHQPISWQMASKEIKQKTKLGKKVGEFLERLGII